MTSDPEPFDVCGELPAGTTVLEASAGTGKTHTIAALAARYVAEGVAELGEVMMVTFGRMATDELRVRVRDRLRRAEAELAQTRAGAPLPAGIDDVGRLLCTGSGEDLAARHDRLRRALAEFDAATIATTHEFCLRMLDGLGVLGDREPDAIFVEDLGDLTAEVARDVYLRRYAGSGDPPLPFDKALDLAHQVVTAGHTHLVPAPRSDGPDAAERRVAYAREVREEVRRRKEAGRLFSYDDMLTRLRESLRHPERGEQAAERLRHRYPIVLVDEFQDTDPVQWDIVRRTFHGHSTLILIGDPKQAIYAFRGADVYSYLDAVGQADRVATLGANWRSDEAVTTGLQAIMGGASLGDENIVVRPVHSLHTERRLCGPAGRQPPPAVRLRIVPPDPDPERAPRVDQVRPVIQADLVADISRVLAERPQLHLGQTRTLRPSDIAVLVRVNRRGEAIRDALIEAGVPAVMLGSGSVFAAPVAAEWLILLVALEQPRQALVRQAALTCFLGWTVSDLASADDADLTALSARIRWWSRVLGSRGVAALLEVVSSDEGLAERVLSRTGGERTLTDLRHVGQALHAAMVSGRLGVAALVEWLRERMAEATADTWSDGTRRLETDAEAVQILTVHRSKGLQFPVVYVPEAWDTFVRTEDTGQVLRLHEDGGCVLDVGGVSGAGRFTRLAREQAENAGEDLRLLYVALTRAQCQAVTWWAATARNTECSALHRFLFRSRRDGEPERRYPIPADPLAAIDLAPHVAVETVSPRQPAPAPVTSSLTADLDARLFTRELDLGWRRTSYSALTAAAHAPGPTGPSVGSEPESAALDDEINLAPLPSASPPEEEVALAAPSPMQELPSGVEFGTVVHAVYEAVDPQAPDLAAAVQTACAAALSRATPGSLTADALAAGLLRSYRTPLGPLAAHRTLADFSRQDRLTELAFELPLCGGDRTTAELRLGDVAPLLADHLEAADPLVGYPSLLDQPGLAEQPLRGYLTGSIDAALRLRDDRGEARYLVVDYKTNWLGVVDGPVLTLGDYTPARLAEAMLAAHYPLQALLYSVALHRMLRWRQPAYQPGRHLGGVLYLFVRGLNGPETPVVGGAPCGVFGWQPAPELVVALSDLLDGRRS